MSSRSNQSQPEGPEGPEPALGGGFGGGVCLCLGGFSSTLTQRRRRQPTRREASPDGARRGAPTDGRLGGFESRSVARVACEYAQCTRPESCRACDLEF
jgi:hypothetical protein